ncbi:MAG: lysophospholipid acyltransferase family protein [Steroidobacterales bacterium]
MQYLRSLVFTAFMMVTACLFGAFMGVCFWLPYRTQFAIARFWASMIFRALAVVCGLKYTVSGRENIPAGNHILMSNHTSAWETIVFFLLFPEQVWVLKRELLWIPFVGWGLKMLRPIAIDRGAGHRAVNQVVEQGQQRLAAGLWVIIFPEGTRVYPGQVRKYGLSGALLASASGKLVVPLSHDAVRYWTRRSLLKKSGTIHVVIGKPIETAGKDPRQLNDEVRAAIEAGLASMPAA